MWIASLKVEHSPNFWWGLTEAADRPLRTGKESTQLRRLSRNTPNMTVLKPRILLRIEKRGSPPKAASRLPKLWPLKKYRKGLFGRSLWTLPQDHRKSFQRSSLPKGSKRKGMEHSFGKFVRGNPKMSLKPYTSSSRSRWVGISSKPTWLTKPLTLRKKPLVRLSYILIPIRLEVMR
jgi:hypothetical protein